jgi:hypothetical protein
MRRVFVRVGLVFASCLIVFGLLEGWLRIRYAFHPPRKGQDNAYIFTEYDPEIGWRNRPESTGQLRTPNGSVSVTTTREGFRADRLYGKPTKKPRILVLGDSFAWGYGIETYERFSEQVERMSGGKWEVINAGVLGYDTAQELLLFRRLASKYRPDLTIAVFGLDDLLGNLLDQHSGYPKPRFVLHKGQLTLTNIPVPQRSIPWEQAVERELSILDRRTWTGRMDKVLRVWLRSYPYLLKRLKLASYLHDARMRSSEALALSEALFKTFRDEVASAGGRLVVLLKPFGESLEKGDQLDLYSYVRTRLEASGVATINPLASLREINEKSPVYFPADRHWNAKGHEVVAQVIFQTIQANGWLRLQPNPPE